MNPTVSILIPVYNRDKYISECIDSAINQTYRDIEIIVIDNASTDKTWNICQNYEKLDSRVKAYRNNVNIGPLNNWIECVKNAKGKYCKILFSDDVLDVRCIEKMCEVFQKHEVAFVFCSVRMGETILKSKIKYYNKKKIISSYEYFKGLLTGRTPVSPGAVLITKNELEQNLLTNIKTSKQWDYKKTGAGVDAMIMLQSCLKNNKVGCVNIPLVFFRIHEEGLTVIDQSNEVTGAYTSVFCYFSKNYISWICWMKTLSLLWVKTMLKKRRYYSPFSFVQSNEGNGSIIELATMILLSPFSIIRLYLNR